MLHLFRLMRHAMSSMHASPQRAVKKLIEKAPARMKPLLIPDANGNTLLHRAAEGAMDKQSFVSHLQIVGVGAATVMAKIVNNDGKIPLHIASEHNADTIDPFIPETILELTKCYERSDHVFDRKEVFQQYQNQSMSEQAQKHIKLACDVVEDVADYGLKSITYPNVNDMKEEEYIECKNKLNVVRRSATKGHVAIMYDFPSELTPSLMASKQLAHLDNETFHTLSLRTGNCFEFAMLGLHLLIAKYGQENSELYRLKEGDHMFVVIGRDKKSDPALPETFGEDAVVCDVHAKRVYLAKELPDKMMGWTYGALPPADRKALTAWTRTSYNPLYHSLTMAFSLSENHTYTLNPRV